MGTQLGKFYKKINWLINGAMIGLIVGGLIQRSVYTLVIGAIVGVSLAVIIKIVTWIRAKSFTHQICIFNRNIQQCTFSCSLVMRYSSFVQMA